MATPLVSSAEDAHAAGPDEETDDDEGDAAQDAPPDECDDPGDDEYDGNDPEERHCSASGQQSEHSTCTSFWGSRVGVSFHHHSFPAADRCKLTPRVLR